MRLIGYRGEGYAPPANPQKILPDSAFSSLPTSMWSFLFLLLVYLIPKSTGRICPPDTGPVFLLGGEYSDRHNHCFDYCGRTNCSAVLINPVACVALTRADLPHPDSKTFAIHKHCVQNVVSTQIVVRETSRVLQDHTEKIEKAVNEFHCLSICTQQTKFTCRSLMYYEESGDCLLNSANSDTAEMNTDTDGFKVVYMERRLPGDSPCISSFAAVPPLSTRVRGEFRKGNLDSWEKCLDGCNDCDKVVYGNDCLLLDESGDGKLNDVSTQIVFENICKEAPTPSCPMDESLFVTRGGTPEAEGKECLNRCLNSKECLYAYKDEGMCQLSPVLIPGRNPIIERVCPGLGALESGVLFEEKNKCPTGPGLRFTGLNLYQCMALCLTHPTSSCDSISYRTDSEVCELLDSSTFTSYKNSEYCLHFSLGIIEGRQLKSKKRLTGKTGKQRPQPAQLPEPEPIEAASPGFSKKRPSNLEKTNLKKRNGDELNIETACSLSSVDVKVKSSISNYQGFLFPRNGFENCSKSFKNGLATLRLTLNSSEPCAVEKHGNIYRAVVVIKEKTSDNTPIITSRDRMYTVSCDYSNQNAKVNLTRQLQLRDLPYNNMDIGNGRKTPKLVEMELRSKREEVEPADDHPHNQPITIGHPVELTIRQSSEQFSLSSCIAENHNGNENVTLIEDGCPTIAAKDYIIRGSIKRGKSGYILPLRAFKFRKGNLVRISCVLEHCDNCERPLCGQRVRRNLPSMDRSTQEFQAQLLVQEHEELPPRTKQVCLNRYQFILGTLVWAMILTVEVTVVLYLVWRTKYIRKFLLK